VVKVHSFDVFGTSLIRKVAVPSDVFRLIGAIIARNADIADKDDFTEDFFSARIRAEQRARSGREETTLDEIWHNLRDLLPKLPPTAGPHEELAVERRLLRPNSLTLRQITELRSVGCRIVFTSDTYLPEEFVRKELMRHGLAEIGDGIYASSTTGRTKRSGGLFEIVLNREGIAAGDLHHYGDDPQSDRKAPNRLGIKATLLANSHLNIWERAILSKPIQHRTAASLLAGSMRAFRLSAEFRSTSGSDQLAASLLGPALMVWAAWVLASARRDGVRRLYFASRDAYLLCSAARVLSRHFGDIDCRYLKISRQSILLPATDEICASKMSWLRRPMQPAPLGYFVRKLGLKWTDVAPYFSSLTKTQGEAWLLTGNSEWNEFWRIVQSAPILDLLRKKIQNQRASVLAYLQANGFFENLPVGIVNLGWYATTQMGLRKLSKLGKGTSTLSGYYLALGLRRMAAVDTGKVTALFYEQAHDHQGISPQYEVFKRIDVLDHVFGLAPHGSVGEYKTNGSVTEPVCLPETPSHTVFVEELADAIEAFCKDNQEDALSYSDSATAREILDALISAWCTHPNKPALDTLEHVIVTDAADSNPCQPLLQPWRLLDASKTLIPGRWREKLQIRVRGPIWPEAALCRSGVLATFILRLSAALRFAKQTAFQ
jgi:FMN phosphatase YigB (HAD superfamily)